MSRTGDLERLIRDAYEIIRKYEKIVQTSDRPEEVQRARHQIEEQWGLLREPLVEYLALCRRRDLSVPEDIGEIAVNFGPELEEEAAAYRPALLPLAPQQVSEGLMALAGLMQRPEVWAAAVTFRADLQAACEQINVLSNHKQLHDSFQELDTLYGILDGERKSLATDQMAWEGPMLHEPELQGVIADLLSLAGRAACVADNAWWTQQLGQAQQELRVSIETCDTERLESAARRLSRVLDREPSRVNTRLVAAAGALRLADLVKTLATVRDSLAHPGLDLEAARQLADGVDALAKLNDSLTALVGNHNRWQEIDDELRRVEANLGQDVVELRLAWPDLKSMTQALCGDSAEEWATSLNKVSAELEYALATEVPARIKMLFLRHRSQAGRRFRQVDSDLLALCQDLRKVGESLDLLMRAMQ